jgi:DNA-binding response OmpR family regulator
MSTGRIAIVESDSAARADLESAFAREGFAVEGVPCEAGALERVSLFGPEAIVVDVNAPGVGMALLAGLRRISHAPIITLTTESAVQRAGCIAAGADDALARPFAVEELLARVHAKLRRPALVLGEIARWRDLALDLNSRNVQRGDAAIALTYREYGLLRTLMTAPTRVFSRDRLIECVWGYDFEGGQTVVETYVSYLRKKLDVFGAPSYIRTVRSVGYGMGQ